MLTLTDLFCGAGGSSTGAVDVPGVVVKMAANHWQLAVDTHNTNHPDADHACADVSQVDPRYFPTTDLLWASPECTNHSQAKGRKRQTDQLDMFAPLPDEAAERSRATMWDVVRFTEHHRYKAVLVENVVDAYHWPPFRSWLLAMESLGYSHQLVFLNSMHAQAAGLPAPQSRDRMYVVFHRVGDTRPDVARWQRPRAWCTGCSVEVRAVQAWKNPTKTTGRYRQQYLYRCPNGACRHQVVEPGWLPASAAIDWTLPGQRIGDRTKPLADKTRRRIAAGIARYWSPVHLEAGGHTYDAADPKHRGYGDPNSYYRAWTTEEPIKTLHTIESKALAVPVEGRDGKTAAPLTGALRTQTTRLETALVVPAGGTWNDTASPGSAPMRTRTTRETDAVVMPPFLAELRGGGSTHRPASDPLCTVTAGGNHHALVTSYYGKTIPHPATEALPTVTTVDRHALVMRNNSSTGEGAEMVTPAAEVLRTMTTTGHQSVLTPGDLAAAEAQVDDVLFRMLEPREVIAAMAFPDTYVVLGNRREQVRMAGNAVTPPAARDLISAVVEALVGAA
jgi:DNA (cytosine-5)-methyltransferase 1